MDKCPTVVRHAILSFAFGLLLSGEATFAGSATWSATPGNGNWNVATNWSPTTIPNSAADGATFNASSVHSISLSASTQVNGIYFGLAATSPYTITTSPGLTFTISGRGISNNSPATQNFVASVSSAFIGLTCFTNSASAGTLTSFTNNGTMFSGSFYGGGTHFFNTSTADHARFINNGGGLNGALGGITGFYDGATAASAIINNNGRAGGGKGYTTFTL